VQGPQSNFLSNLATLFQNVANGGSLSQLQPQNPSQGQVQQVYNQGSAPHGVSGLSQPGGSQSSNNSILQQLFATISGEVSSALGSK
jgi:hypothetical protein